MKILYANNETATFRADLTSYTSGQSTPTVSLSDSVTGFCLLDMDITGIVVEASTDSFSSTVYSKTITSGTSHIEDLSASPVAAADWRVRFTADGDIGHVYLGTMVEVSNPAYPYSFEKVVVSDNRKSLGGVEYSKVHYTQYQGELQWPNIPATEVTDWKNWYDTSSGLKIPFVVEEPAGLTPYLVTGSAGGFPLRRRNPNFYEGRLRLEEAL